MFKNLFFKKKFYLELCTSMQPYHIHLEHFEGPFDLLLFFIERDELDIYDIPISKITQDFLDYLHTLEKLEIEVASEFIYMAATLIKIKTQLLLPQPENNISSIEDPRHELVQQLVAYKQFKKIQTQLQQMEDEAFKLFPSGCTTAIVQHKPEDELQNITLYQLALVYKRVLEQQKLREKKPQHVVQKYPYTPEEVKAFIQTLIFKHGKIDFISLVHEKPDKLFIIFSFLSILEMVHYQQIRVVIGDGFNNFWIMGMEYTQEAEPKPVI